MNVPFKTLTVSLVFILGCATPTVNAKPIQYEPSLNYQRTELIQPLSPVNIQPIQELTYSNFSFGAPNTYSNTYTPSNCTSYVAGRKNIPNSWGNANTWAVRASAQGLTVSPTPIVGTIAQTSAGGYGHVALVLAVNGDTVTIAEQNYDYAGGIRERVAPISEFVYIYI